MLFCPIKSIKSSSKKSIHQLNNRQPQIDPNQLATNQNHTNTSRTTNAVASAVTISNAANVTNTKNTPIESNQQTTNNLPYRYVTDVFVAKVDDELDVKPDDVVLYEFSDSSESGSNWSHVLCLRTNLRGFVPSDILSTEPRRVSQCRKKKMPRSLAPIDTNGDLNHVLVSPISHHHHSHSHLLHQNGRNHHHHHHHHGPMGGGGPSFNGDLIMHPSIRSMPSSHVQHQCTESSHQSTRFVVPQSSRGSSGKQTFPKYPVPDLRHQFSSPGYYNLQNSSQDPHYEQYEMECRPFPQENYGLYVVLHNFVGREENDLNVRPADYVRVLNKDDDDWYWVRREYDGAEGFVPSKFILDYEQIKSMLNKGNSTVTMKSSNQNDSHTYINHMS